ncbi:hypothetical protein [Faecalimonas umbilicata]|uniref:hypothetical protein n=1 Tax=Faecalimonas umbilicata TaxID=1912855 RepID=UPI0039938A53
MNFIKKQAAGFYLMLLALILGTAGIVFYVINCNTAYFSNLGISWGVVGCLVAGVVLEILFVRTGKVAGNAGTGYSSDSGGVLLMAGFVFFVRLRVNSIATILSFERNAQTMADLSSAIIGMGCTLAAVIMTIISSFFRTVREEK